MLPRFAVAAFVAIVATAASSSAAVLQPAARAAAPASRVSRGSLQFLNPHRVARGTHRPSFPAQAIVNDEPPLSVGNIEEQRQFTSTADVASQFRDQDLSLNERPSAEDQRLFQSSSPLMFAINNLDVDMCFDLVTAGAQVTTEHIFHAAYLGAYEVLQVLLYSPRGREALKGTFELDGVGRVTPFHAMCIPDEGVGTAQGLPPRAQCASRDGSSINVDACRGLWMRYRRIVTYFRRNHADPVMDLGDGSTPFKYCKEHAGDGKIPWLMRIPLVDYDD